MRYGELARLAIGGLWRQKMRTTLTLVGVTIGTCALVFSFSLGLGLRAFIDNQFKGRDEFWKLIVHVSDPAPDPSTVPADKVVVRGDMSDSRRSRLREALAERYLSTRPRKPPVPLSASNIAAISALPDVIEVRTFRTSDSRVTAAGAEHPVTAPAVTGPLADLKPRLIAGRLPDSEKHEIVLSELVLYDMGWRSDLDIERAIGMPIRVVVGGVRNAPPLALARLLIGHSPGEELTTAQLELLEKLTATLPQRLESLNLSAAEQTELKQLLQPHPDDDVKSWDSTATAVETFYLSGVVRVLTRADHKEFSPLSSWELVNGSVFIPPAAGAELFDKLPTLRSALSLSAEVRIRPGGDVPRAVAAIEAMGFGTYSSAKWFANAKREVTLIAGGLNLFALIALFVAGIGITNTLVTSVVERTREIGILRSVGATRGQVLALFLLEGTFIGFVGSGLGVCLARVLAVPADHWVWTLIEKQAEGEKLLEMAVFEFPWWLIASAVGFSIAVTTIAAFYPARRAARVHPIEALRYG